MGIFLEGSEQPESSRGQGWDTFNALYGTAPGIALTPTQFTAIYGRGGSGGQLPATFEEIWQTMPVGWRDAVQQQQGGTGWDGAGTAAITKRLGWPANPAAPPQQGQPMAGGAQLLTMSVRSCTKLQLRGNAQAQLEARTRYASSALREGLEATGEEAGAEAQTGLRRSMARLWKLEWDNRPKEALWRLMVNGVRGAGGHDVTPAGACPCGWHPPAPAGAAGGEAPALAWRKHAFWHCPVAAAVRREIHSGLGRAPSCANTWLLQPPRKTMHARVWEVVGMVAVAAMEHGRKAMWVMHKERLSSPHREQSLITAFFPNQRGTLSTLTRDDDSVPRASRKVAAQFWCLLQDFADMAKPQWPPTPPDHPFIRVDAQGVHLNLPAGFALPSDL